ncbi:MAG: glutamate formimidoyltransferase [Dehalococcoidia bacterium]
MNKIVECVPNFSEGRDIARIEQITDELRKVPGIKLLDVATDADHNRTVLTFVGPPEPVRQAAYDAIARAVSIIDMSGHKGQHPRLGACDVCPFIPIQGATMVECVALANDLAREVAQKLHIPVYLYEEAARVPERKNLATIRAGEYEGLAQKLQDPRWQPDYGPTVFNPRSGATVIGAREFLIAYNVYLSAADTDIAHRIAGIIRESGRTRVAEGGSKIRIPGVFQSVKAVGVALEKPTTAQVSMNLTNYKVTPMHIVFEAIKDLAALAGARVLSSEIVGLIPREAILDAGRFYQPAEQSRQKLIEAAVKNLALDASRRFDPRKKIIEYLIEED